MAGQVSWLFTLMRANWLGVTITGDMGHLRRCPACGRYDGL
jgi:hypothetical protein